MNNIYVGDLHGSLYAFEKAIETFEVDQPAKMIFIGDYCDSYTCTSTEILHLVKGVIRFKQENMDRVELLLGNHDWQYLFYPEYRCSGFREDIRFDLHKLLKDNQGLFKVAHLEDGVLATHAGVTDRWFVRYADRLDNLAARMCFDMWEDFDHLLNAIMHREDRWMLATIPLIRGGDTHSYGGPLWADYSEIVEYGLMPRFTQVVGHNKVDKIHDYTDYIKDMGNNIKGALKLTFIDCLHKETKFYHLKK